MTTTKFNKYFTVNEITYVPKAVINPTTGSLDAELGGLTYQARSRMTTANGRMATSALRRPQGKAKLRDVFLDIVHTHPLGMRLLHIQAIKAFHSI